MTTVQIPRSLINQLLNRAQNSPEAEVCGLIGIDAIQRFYHYPVTNIAEDVVQQFEMDPQQQINVFRQMREAGQNLFAIYHSHPHTEAKPSLRDIEMAYYPNALYLIISLNTKGVLAMRGFEWQTGKFVEVILSISP